MDGHLRRLRLFFERHPLLGWCCLGLAYALLFLLPHTRLWDGKHFLGWDIIRQAWPNIEYLWSSFVRGEIPLWNPYEKAGFSFIGDPETGVFYPVHWLMALLTGTTGAGPFVMLLQVLVHVGIAGVGMHHYLRRRQLPTASCWLGGTAYILSSRLAKSKDQTALGTVVWFPWMLIAVEESVRRPSWRSSALLGVIVAVDLHAGYPPNFFRNLVALGLVGVFELVTHLGELPAEQRRRYLLRFGGYLVAAGVLCLLLTAPVLAALSSIGETARAKMSLAEVLRSSVRIPDALLLWAPGLRGQSSFLIYLGLIPALLAGYACFRYSRERLLWLGVGAFFFLLACGGNAFILPAAINALPGFSLFRVPEQYLFIVAFFVAALGARGLADLLATPPEARRQARQRLLVLTGIALVLNLVALVLTKLAKAPQVYLIDAAGAGILLCLATGILWMGLTSDRSAWRKAAVGLLLPLLLLDVGLQNVRIYNISRPYPTPSHDAQLSKLRGIQGEYRIADEGHFRYRVSLRKSVRDLYGRQTALISERYRRYIAQARSNHRLLAAANVRYYSGPYRQTIHRQASKQSRRTVGSIVELLDAAPLAYWIGAPKLVKAGPQALAALKSGEPGTVGVLEKKDLSKAEQKRVAAMRSEAQRVKARLLHYGRNSLKIAVDVPAAGLVVINEKYARGWRATIDGKPARILRANYIFRGVLVPAGLHELELSYRPTKVLVGVGFFGVATLLILGMLIVSWVRRRKRSGQR